VTPSAKRIVENIAPLWYNGFCCKMKCAGGETNMANIKSAIKRVRVNNDSRLRNQALKSDLRTAVKHVETAVSNNDAATAKTALLTASSKIDKAAQSGVIHRNKANRQKSNLTKKVNAIGA
jgi:small subunit ribosomal protein S20